MSPKSGLKMRFAAELIFGKYKQRQDLVAETGRGFGTRQIAWM
jgi:hypothetical protein